MSEFYNDGYELDALPNGTPVKVFSAYGKFKEDQIIYRKKDSSVDDDLNCRFSENPDGSGDVELMNYNEVVRLPCNACIEKPQPEAPLGVYRPDLGTRKVGKVRVELVDDGFPLALREVAKVMTWAQTAKGYKDHDWQNLPNAEQALAAAASRHRTDHIKQRIVEGLDITDCVDNESKLLHKAHEAFGVLAQLELMLRGEF